MRTEIVVPMDVFQKATNFSLLLLASQEKQDFLPLLRQASSGVRYEHNNAMQDNRFAFIQAWQQLLRALKKYDFSQYVDKVTGGTYVVENRGNGKPLIKSDGALNDLRWIEIKGEQYELCRTDATPGVDEAFFQRFLQYVLRGYFYDWQTAESE